MSGFIKLHRAIQSHWLAADKPYCHRAAWDWLLLEAAYFPHADGRGRIQNRGTVFTSQVKMAEVFGWDRKKIRRFLERLSAENMIRFSTDDSRDKGGTVIEILNYAIYQDRDARACPDDGREMTLQIPHVTPQANPIVENGSVSPPISPPISPRTVQQLPTNGTQLSNGRTKKGKTTHVGEGDAVNFQMIWNALPAPFPKIQAWTTKRETAFTTRMRDKFFAENFKIAIERMAASDFCRGGGERGWIADVDWFLQDDTVAKLIEGKFSAAKRQDGAGAPGVTGTTARPSAWDKVPVDKVLSQPPSITSEQRNKEREAFPIPSNKVPF